ncbi:MAG: NADP-dependent malic enzyme [Gammaproteobacteria bacterium]|nr:NADP-dependent malic enzyme [Gammaproteobacteria bacterium]NIN62288.1 NADP-dependent malic enzyme [Gammaproteobacteria bacterium]NIO62297.1 NADP-dependent malic enzyme [Gammaproteobacteria bacterium]NIP49679.1 NADP-dependent malic enzyme [Gammaproteobacteria bacterium]NIQ10904.1 NADP-dependent malic enzyme [Gammaproteobacteria bacterium]
MAHDIDKASLEYHRHPRPGKIEVVPTKPLANQRDLSLAYSPGVAEPCRQIVDNPAIVDEVTSRSNLVAVISNGTAVLGLGDIGPLAAKPVMEGKGVLFKKFAGIDVFDIEINEKDPDKLIEIIASLEPTFGGINLEDIKSPECFQIEGILRSRLNIPIFHDDQHGTAIIVAAAIMNALTLVNKKIEDVKLVSIGAGASGIACLKLLVNMGMKKENIIAVDRQGVIYRKRSGLTPHKKLFANDTEARTLADAIKGADIFLGLSGPGVVKQEMIRSMAEKPIVMALSNPIPEILPEEVKAVCPDAIIATGRSDYPNQVNNVLCFPFIFRGALDVGATKITKEMQIACVKALAELTREEAPDTVVAAYGGINLKFGHEYLIPKPFDPRLILKLAPAVAQAAMDSGVATRPIKDMSAYHDQLTRYVFESVLIMKPLFERAKLDPKRIVYTEGESHKVLQTAQSMIDEGMALPIVIGRREHVIEKIQELGLRMRPDKDVQIVDVSDQKDPNNTRIGATMIKKGDADALICGIRGRYHAHLVQLIDVLGVREDVSQPAALNILLMKKGVFFIADTAVTVNPTAREIAEITLLAAEGVRRFGITPNAVLLGASNNIDSETKEGEKIQVALEWIRQHDPELMVDGKMRADAALTEELRQNLLPNSVLKGGANLLIMPNIEAAKIAYDLIKVLGDAITIGPVLLGLKQPAHIMTPSATVRRMINTSTIAVVDAQNRDEAKKEQELEKKTRETA